MARSRVLPGADVERAKLIVAFADGGAIGNRTDLSAHRVAVEDSIREGWTDGLGGQHKGSKPRTVTPAVQMRITKRGRRRPRTAAPTSVAASWLGA
jgi:hypothetical protein